MQQMAPSVIMPMIVFDSVSFTEPLNWSKEFKIVFTCYRPFSILVLMKDQILSIHPHILCNLIHQVWRLNVYKLDACIDYIPCLSSSLQMEDD